MKVFVQEAEGLKLEISIQFRILHDFREQLDLSWRLDGSSLRSEQTQLRFWMWHEKIGWFWTGNEYVPDLYVNDFSSWFRFSSSVANGIYLTWPIAIRGAGVAEHGNYFNKQQNLVKGHIRQALEGLVSNDEIINCIEAHSFAKNKLPDKYELKFKEYPRH